MMWRDTIGWKQSRALTLPRLTFIIQHLQRKLVIYHWRKVHSGEEVAKKRLTKMEVMKTLTNQLWKWLNEYELAFIVYGKQFS